MTHRDSPHLTDGTFSQPASADVTFRVDCAPRPEKPAKASALRLLHSPAQDPYILHHAGRYHYCESTPHGIFVRSADRFEQLGLTEAHRVWAPSASGPCSRNLWAPELHVIDGRCYIYFAADDGKNANHRMWVLAGRDDNPIGPFELIGPLDTQGWAIDGTVFTAASGERLFIWSGWPGKQNGRQNLYAARMASPTQLAGTRVLLAEADRRWERRGMPICEGPQILLRNGRVFIVYSASGSWTADYCLGLLSLEGSDFLNPNSWRKSGPIFAKNKHAAGVGHCCFVTASDGEDWLVYHAKTSRRNGWSDREVRAQTFGWSPDGSPDFGTPLAVIASGSPVLAR